MRVSVCLGAILIPEYLDFHSGYSTCTTRSRIAGIYSGIYSGINSYSGISQTNAPLVMRWSSGEPLTNKIAASENNIVLVLHFFSTNSTNTSLVT